MEHLQEQLEVKTLFRTSIGVQRNHGIYVDSRTNHWYLSGREDGRFSEVVSIIQTVRTEAE